MCHHSILLNFSRTRSENLRDYTNDDLRVEAYAEDKQYFFYQFPQFWEDCRLYRSSKKTRKWECCCANLDEMEIFAKKLKKTRKNKQFRSDLQVPLFAPVCRLAGIATPDMYIV